MQASTILASYSNLVLQLIEDRRERERERVVCEANQRSIERANERYKSATGIDDGSDFALTVPNRKNLPVIIRPLRVVPQRI